MNKRFHGTAVDKGIIKSDHTDIMETEIADSSEVVVMLALLNKDLEKMMEHCKKNQWKYNILNSNNLELYIPKNSLHLLFYLGHQILSGTAVSVTES